jgi:hypothetical protein
MQLDSDVYILVLHGWQDDWSWHGNDGWSTLKQRCMQTQVKDKLCPVFEPIGTIPSMLVDLHHFIIH